MHMKPPTLLFAGPGLSSTRPARIELRRRGARVGVADRPDEALRLAVEDLPDVVVLDEEAGGRWPEDWLERLRSLRPEVELVVLEAPGSTGLHGLGLGALFSGPKPLSTATLVEVLSAPFERRLARAGDAARVRILCVDDDPRWLSSLQRLLGRRGYDVATFSDGREALASLGGTSPGAAVVDVMMPGMDGFKLTERIAEATRGRVPVVLLTGHGAELLFHEGLCRGASWFLTKEEGDGRLIDVIDYLTADLDASERGLLERSLAGGRPGGFPDGARS